jgi:hypothetical protein
MKSAKTGFVVSFALVLIAFSSNGVAGEYEPTWYGSVHLGKTNTSWNQGNQDFSYLKLGGSWGYRFSDILAAELFMSFTTNPQKDELVSAMLGQDVKTEFDAVGFYLTAQSRGDYYIKGRAGITESRFIYSASGYQDEAGKDIGFSYGFGVGMISNGLRFEAEYIVMPEVDDPIFDSTSYDSKLLMISVGMDF